MGPHDLWLQGALAARRAGRPPRRSPGRVRVRAGSRGGSRPAPRRTPSRSRRCGPASRSPCDACARRTRRGQGTRPAERGSRAPRRLRKRPRLDDGRSPSPSRSHRQNRFRPRRSRSRPTARSPHPRSDGKGATQGRRGSRSTRLLIPLVCGRLAVPAALGARARDLSRGAWDLASASPPGEPCAKVADRSAELPGRAPRLFHGLPARLLLLLVGHLSVTVMCRGAAAHQQLLPTGHGGICRWQLARPRHNVAP